MGGLCKGGAAGRKFQIRSENKASFRTRQTHNKLITALRRPRAFKMYLKVCKSKQITPETMRGENYKSQFDSGNSFDGFLADA